MAGQGGQQGQQPQGGGVGNPTNAQEIQALLDNLDAQLVAGKISEATYNNLKTKWEQRLAQLGGQH
jgi:hypothetical protein